MIVGRAAPLALAVVLSACGDGSVDPAAAVVAIESSGCRLAPTRAVGTVVGDGLVLTVAHAVAGESEIVVRTGDDRELDATVAAIDTELDAAVLRVEELDVDAVSSRPYTEGEDVSLLVIDDDEVDRRHVTVRRRVTIRTSDIYRQGEHLRPGLELAATVRSGDSGGGLVATDGRLLGIVWAASRRAEDRAWAVTSESLAPLLAAAEAGRPPGAVACSR